MDKNVVTTIYVNDLTDIDISNAIVIDEEIFQILPLESNEGQLYKFVDKDANKVARVRVKRNLTPTALDPATPRETAASNANNLSNQHAPQAETPGK